MKHILTIIAISVIASVTAHGQEERKDKSYTREGDTFVQQKTRSSASSADQITAYKWRDSKGNEYPIVLHTYTRGEKAGKTTCYVVKVSAKTGKEYKYYIKDGERIAEEILRENL